ncbi:unnamed protein product [Phaeothamnion confervicola]
MELIGSVILRVLYNRNFDFSGRKPMNSRGGAADGRRRRQTCRLRVPALLRLPRRARDQEPASFRTGRAPPASSRCYSKNKEWARQRGGVMGIVEATPSWLLVATAPAAPHH